MLSPTSLFLLGGTGLRRHLPRGRTMKRIGWLLVVGVFCPTVILAGESDRAELLGSPRCVENAVEPSFAPFTAEKLQDQLQVISSRSFAVFGFNNPEVQIRLPRCDNSVYAAVDFSPVRLVDSKGRDVQYERERGLYDHDSHSDEIRFVPVQGKIPVEFARAEGTIHLRYPVRIKTLSLKSGARALEGVTLSIDGPFVSWTGKELTLPESASFSTIPQWRAFDASGRRLEGHPHKGFSMSKGMTTETYPYWGAVKEVRVDVVDEWAEMEIAYSLPPVEPLPHARIGTAPKTDRVKTTPGGKVTMQVLAAKRVPGDAVAGGISREDAIAQLKTLGFRRFDANAFILAATRGRADALKLFIAGGMPVDTECGGRTALLSAAMMGHVEAGKVLIGAGADVNKPDLTGSPPLLRLVMKRNAAELVQAFIDAGADLTVELRGGVTALQLAKMAKCQENVRVLKAAGAR